MADMRRFVLVRLACLFVFLSLPVPAHALFWHWLDELSGPGTFNGYEIEVRLVCFSEPAKQGAEEIKARKRLAAGVVGVIPPGCVFTRVPLENVRRASINLAMSYMYANHTHLEYADKNANHFVHLLTLRPRVWMRPARSVEVGAGVGFYRFTGPGFEPVWRTVLEPFLVDVKPLALVRDALRLGHRDDVTDYPDSQWDLIISFRAGFVYSPKGFDAQDFGAIPGTFHTKRELLPTASVLLDLDPIARWMRRPKIAAPGPPVP
jgi:hypothetical protein